MQSPVLPVSILLPAAGALRPLSPQRITRSTANSIANDELIRSTSSKVTFVRLSVLIAFEVGWHDHRPNHSKGPVLEFLISNIIGQQLVSRSVNTVLTFPGRRLLRTADGFAVKVDACMRHAGRGGEHRSEGEGEEN